MVLRLASGSVTPASALKKSCLGVDVHQRDVVVVAEQRHDLLGLVGAQQPVVDEDAGELVADRLVDQHRGDALNRRRPTGRRSPGPCRPARGSWRSPRRRKAAMVQSPVQPAMWRTKLRDQRRAVGRVHHLGVELHGVELARLVGDGREGRVLRARRRPRSPRGSRVTRSPWLIQTGSRSPFCHTPSNSGLSATTSTRRGRTRGDGRPRPRRRAAPPSSARRSRCRAPARRPRRCPAGARGEPPRSPRPGRRRG